MIEARKASGKPSAVLFTDIDNTFYRADRRAASDKIVILASREQIPIATVTGNSFEVVLARIEKGELPYFSVIAGSVGTEMWVLHTDGEGNKSYARDEDFERVLTGLPYDREAISKLSQDLIDQARLEHPSWDLDFQRPDLEAKYQRDPSTGGVQRYKTSFYLFVSDPHELISIRAAFQDRFPNQQIVISEEVNHNSTLNESEINKKYNIDILPITKLGAIKYIQERRGVDLTAIAGDSGNDSDMLTGIGDLSIQVGGAKPELVEAIETTARSKKGRGSFTKVEQPDGSIKLYYKERYSGLGPESILYAAEVISRAWRIFGAKPENPQTTNL